MDKRALTIRHGLTHGEWLILIAVLSLFLSFVALIVSGSRWVGALGQKISDVQTLEIQDHGQLQSQTRVLYMLKGEVEDHVSTDPPAHQAPRK